MLTGIARLPLAEHDQSCPPVAKNLCGVGDLFRFMKPVFHHKAVNSPFDDPVVYVRVLRERMAILLDAGDLASLSQRDVQKVRHVLVTHMHIDHFVGFDMLLRILLPRTEPLFLYGPEGLIDCVEGKLRGFTWNLVTHYPIELIVCEVRREEVRRASFRAKERFLRRHLGSAPYGEVLLETELLIVRNVLLAHDVPTLGFAIEEKVHINIDKARLVDRGFPVGPWLSEFKRAIRRGMPDELVDTGTGRYRTGDLTDIYTLTRGQKIAYVMDSSPTPENVASIAEFVRGADTLYIEAYFLDREMDLARERNHLTARLAGSIARRAAVGNVSLLHFSPRYRDCPEAIVEEAMESFRR